MLIAAIILAALLQWAVRAESSSYMNSGMNVWSSNGIYGGYVASRIVDDVYGKRMMISARAWNHVSHYVGIDLGQERLVKSIFVANCQDNSGWSVRLSGGSLFVGNGLTPSTSKFCAWVTDSGTYECPEPITGRYVFLQVTNPVQTDGYIIIEQIRVFGLTSLSRTATLYFSSTPSSSVYGA